MKEIKMFSDFACPFCYIGFSIMDKLRKEKSFNFTHIPLLLNPNESLEGSDLSQHVSQERIESGYERIENLGNEYNLLYNNKYKRFNTNRLHKASLYAADNDKFFEFSKLSFEAIFTHTNNIGLQKNINIIAKEVGLNIQDMNKKIDNGYYDKIMSDAADLAEEYYVTSVPTFIVDGEKMPTRLEPYEDFIKQLLR